MNSAASPDNDNLLVRSAVRQAGAEPLPPGSEAIDSVLTPLQAAERGVSAESTNAYRDAFQFITLAVHAATAGRPIDLGQGTAVAQQLVRVVRSRRDVLSLAMERSPNFSFRQHSVNVAVIGARIAHVLDWTASRIADVALAGLLHDIGTIKLPNKLLFKTLGLTPIERKEIAKRPIYSAGLVSGIPGYEWLATVIGQVYERENGCGYPNGLPGSSIREEAKILGVADVFEACLHARPQRGALTGYQAIEVITSDAALFADRVTRAMIRAFSVYPINELVLLNTGELGAVVDINEGNPLRPIVRIVRAADGSEVRSLKTIDLADNPQIFIRSAISPSEFPSPTAH